MKTFKTTDNLNLFYNDWTIENPKAVVALVHGLGEHIMRYDHWAKKFNSEGFAVVGADSRGHGKSEGNRGHIPDYEQFMTDVNSLIEEAKKLYPNKKIILYGHSLGGAQVLNYLVKRQPELSAVVSTSPFITLAEKPNPVVLFLGKITRSIVPGFTQENQVNPNYVSRDPKVVQDYINDPLVHGKLSSALGIDALNAGKFLNEYKGEIKTPTLLIHGSDDKLTNPEGTLSFYNNTTGNRTLKIFPNLAHETHNEPEKDMVFAYILGWLNGVIF